MDHKHYKCYQFFFLLQTRTEVPDNAQYHKEIFIPLHVVLPGPMYLHWGREDIAMMVTIAFDSLKDNLLSLTHVLHAVS